MREILTALGLHSAVPIGLEEYLLVAAALFVLGLVGCITRRNAIGILIGIELMLNAAVLNFMAFWRFSGGSTSGAGALAGPAFGLFIILLAACEAAIALAVLLNVYFNFGTIEVDFLHEMKE